MPKITQRGGGCYLAAWLLTTPHLGPSDEGDSLLAGVSQGNHSWCHWDLQGCPRGLLPARGGRHLLCAPCCAARPAGRARDSPPGAHASLWEGRLCVPVRGPGPRAAPPFLVLVTPFLLPRSTAELPVAKGQRVAHSRPPGVCQMTE